MYVDRSSSTTEGGPRRKQQLLEIRNHNETQNSQQKNFNLQMKLEADEFKKQFRFVDKEKLFMELQSYKSENNLLREENVRHKTRIHQTEKELERYEKICEDMQNKLPKALNNVSHELLIIQLKKQNKDLNKQLRDKIKENDHLKKNFKVTRLQELEIDRKAYLEETIRLRKIIQEGSASFEAMQQKYGESLLLEGEVQKLLKTNDYLLQEKQALQQKSTQGDEFIKQLQSLYKISQQKQAALDKQIADLRSSIKKLQNEKTNLKTTIKQLQDSQYQAIASLPSAQKSPPKQTQPKPINSLLVDEMRYKLTIRGITNEQLLEMLDGLKSQAKDQKIQVHAEDLQHILSQDPFIFTDNNKIQQILQSLHGVGNTLVDSFYKIIGEYKTFQNFPTFDFQMAQAKMKQQLKIHEKAIQDYWARNKAKGSTVTKTEVRKMLNSLNLNWDEPQQLFYFLNLFEKSFENLYQINIKDTIDPFIDEWDQQQQESKQDQPQSKQLGNPRISEESDEELFDKQSQDYSLDEKALPQNQQNSEQYNEDDEQQEIVFRDEGQIRQGNQVNGQDTSNQNMQPKIQFETEEQNQEQDQEYNEHSENENNNQSHQEQPQEKQQIEAEQKAEEEDDQYKNDYEEENGDDNNNNENKDKDEDKKKEEQQVQEDYQEEFEQEQEKQYEDDQFE